VGDDAKPTQDAVVAPPRVDTVGIQGANGDSAEASRNLLAALHGVHSESMQRNSSDSQKDGVAMQGDNDSIKLAAQTSGLSQDLKAYIAKGGDFSDPQGKQLGHKLIAALRQERDDHTDDRQTDLQYSGPNGVSKSVQDGLQVDSKAIAHDVAELGNPKQHRTDLLKGIEAGAADIAATVAKQGGQAGKDLKDAASESKVISADAAALLSGKLTAEQTKLVTADMASKTELIQKQLGDAPDEVRYAQHDTAAIKAGADLETVIRSTMKTHSATGLNQLAGLLDDFHNARGQGVLDTIVNDRQADLKLEPAYIAANNNDNAKNNTPILNFSDPFKKN
jgi:hypothetical protein